MSKIQGINPFITSQVQSISATQQSNGQSAVPQRINEDSQESIFQAKKNPEINPAFRGMNYKAVEAVNKDADGKLYNDNFNGILNFDGPRHIGNSKMAGERLNYVS